MPRIQYLLRLLKIVPITALFILCTHPAKAESSSSAASSASSSSVCNSLSSSANWPDFSNAEYSNVYDGGSGSSSSSAFNGDVQVEGGTLHARRIGAQAAKTFVVGGGINPDNENTTVARPALKVVTSTRSYISEILKYAADRCANHFLGSPPVDPLTLANLAIIQGCPLLNGAACSLRMETTPNFPSGYRGNLVCDVIHDDSNSDSVLWTDAKIRSAGNTNVAGLIVSARIVDILKVDRKPNGTFAYSSRFSRKLTGKLAPTQFTYDLAQTEKFEIEVDTVLPNDFKASAGGYREMITSGVVAGKVGGYWTDEMSTPILNVLEFCRTPCKVFVKDHLELRGVSTLANRPGNYTESVDLLQTVSGTGKGDLKTGNVGWASATIRLDEHVKSKVDITTPNKWHTVMTKDYLGVRTIKPLLRSAHTEMTVNKSFVADAPLGSASGCQIVPTKITATVNQYKEVGDTLNGIETIVRSGTGSQYTTTSDGKITGFSGHWDNQSFEMLIDIPAPIPPNLAQRRNPMANLAPALAMNLLPHDGIGYVSGGFYSAAYVENTNSLTAGIASKSVLAVPSHVTYINAFTYADKLARQRGIDKVTQFLNFLRTKGVTVDYVNADTVTELKAELAKASGFLILQGHGSMLGLGNAVYAADGTFLYVTEVRDILKTARNPVTILLGTNCFFGQSSEIFKSLHLEIAGSMMAGTSDQPDSSGLRDLFHYQNQDINMTSGDIVEILKTLYNSDCQ